MKFTPSKSLITTLFIPVLILLLVPVMRGSQGNPLLSSFINDSKGGLGGPFESSGSTSRYALTQAIIDNHSVFLNREQARFASPDVAKYNDRYFSLFAPGVSFLGAPFYWLGEQFGLQQLGAYASTALLAVTNAWLVVIITRKLGTSHYSSLISGMIFLFATNALTYATTYTQHHLSTTILLLAIVAILNDRSWFNNFCLGILFAVGITVDLPNAIILLPLLIYGLYRQLDIVKGRGQFKIKFRLNIIGFIIGFLPIIGLLGLYNYQFTGSALSLPQFVGQSLDFTEQAFVPQAVGSEPDDRPLHFRLPFMIRNQFYGLYVFFLSDQRSILVYCPIILFGIIGIFLAYKQNKLSKTTITAMLSTLVANILIYSLFIDPTGSWAFGPRYLIPGLAVLAAFTGSVIDRFNRRPAFTLLFIILIAYSLAVSVLGAMTTTMVPPKIEAVAMPEPIPYTYEYNWQLITERNLNSSLFYQLLLSRRLTALEYAGIYTFIVFSFIMMLYVMSIRETKSTKKQMAEN